MIITWSLRFAAGYIIMQVVKCEYLNLLPTLEQMNDQGRYLSQISPTPLSLYLRTSHLWGFEYHSNNHLVKTERSLTALLSRKDFQDAP